MSEQQRGIERRSCCCALLVVHDFECSGSAGGAIDSATRAVALNAVAVRRCLSRDREANIERQKDQRSRPHGF